jgi:hypothetical protein
MLLFSGGKDDGGLLQTTEILTESGEFFKGPDLPMPLAQHCILGVDQDRVFISGGDITGNNTGTKKAFMYDFKLEASETAVSSRIAP